MMRMWRFCNRWVFLAALAMAAPALAGEPMQQVKQTTDKILAILNDPALKGPSKWEEKKKLISALADERFDWEEIARRALARHWAQRTPEEKKEFIQLFRDLMDRTYLDRVESYSGETMNYEGDSIDGNYAVVRAKALASTKKEIPLEYRLLKKGSQWFVYDISVEGISLVGNYRAQFNSIITRSSYKDLVEKLKAKSIQ